MSSVKRTGHIEFTTEFEVPASGNREGKVETADAEASAIQEREQSESWPTSPAISDDSKGSRGTTVSSRVIFWSRWFSVGIATIIVIEGYRLLNFAWEVNTVFGGAITVLIAGLVGAAGFRLWRWRLAGKQLSNYETLRTDAERALVQRSVKLKNAWQKDAERYFNNPDMQRLLTKVSNDAGDYGDSREFVLAIDRALCQHQDKQAQKLIAETAKKSALAVGISPFATLDMMLVFWHSLRLVDGIAKIYGLRPNGRVRYQLAHKMLRNTFSMGASEIGLQTILPELGLGMGSQLLGRVGQGIGAGVLMSRLGLEALNAVRPVPFHESPPKLKSIVRGITQRATTEELEAMGVTRVLGEKTQVKRG
ncbi:YcjF family protein [uncultured Umboniibacter sp.]|uniref:YcjF family protein n=1 Tax=uncultured Umboniibacter sp. TaxID=1798917 RepID=UPI0026285853|nr:YcjF family protein [uncultured Umboniibacter sp.]